MTKNKRCKTYFIKVLTPLHVGAGQGLSHVDLPIVREVHTNFPFVPGSAIKGSLRSYYLREKVKEFKAKELNISLSDLDKALQKGEKPEGLSEKDLDFLLKAFGTAGEGSENSSGGAGKVIYTDARLLLFPVKSLRGIFQLITCPYVINRYLEDTEGTGDFKLQVEQEKALVYTDNLPTDNKIMLEEFVFDAEQKDELKNIVNSLPLEDYQKERVVCVHDDIFKYMVQSYTEVQTHVKIDPDTGTVKKGTLWTCEYLPAESVLYFNLSFEDEINLEVPEIFHLGGDITTGKGFVRRL